MRAKKKTVSIKKVASKPSDKEMVEMYMASLKHPLKKEVEMVRKIILQNKKLSERIKWNAPSYYYKEDLLTFNLRYPDTVHLVFHHPEIVNIPSALLEGDYKDRRMIYFDNMAAVRKHKAELIAIISSLVERVGGK